MQRGEGRAGILFKEEGVRKVESKLKGCVCVVMGADRFDMSCFFLSS